jgi:ADP-heptose:LPS heptosyltransferase
MSLRNHISRLRRRVAPVGSRRENLARALYVPMAEALKRRALRNIVPNPRCRMLSGQMLQGTTLPSRPRILLLKLDHLGDFIVGLPAMQQVRQHFADARITLVCAPWNRDWAEKSGLFDQVVAFDFFATSIAAAHALADHHYQAFAALGLPAFDLAIDLRHDPDTRPLLARVNASYRAGFYAPWAAGGAGLDISLPDMEHISLAQGSGRPVLNLLRLKLLVHAVIDSLPLAGAKPSPHPALRLRRQAATGLTRPYAILAPGAGSPIRVWDIANMIAVGQELIGQYGLDIVVTGGKGEQASAAALIQALPTGRVSDRTGLDLADLPDLLAGATLYIGNDTGPTHLAAALGVATIGILSGVPYADVWRTLGPKVVVVHGQTDCSPCHLIHPEFCPHNVACMRVITPDKVLQACAQLLQDGG